jgi:hypothetical protein
MVAPMAASRMGLGGQSVVQTASEPRLDAPDVNACYLTATRGSLFALGRIMTGARSEVEVEARAADVAD